MPGDIITERLQTLLRSQIPDDVGMIDHVRELESFYYPTLTRLVEERRNLTIAEDRHKMLKSKSYTETDRKQHLMIMTKDQRAIVELLEVTIKAIEKRITLIQSMLKIISEEYKRSKDDRL